MTFYEWSLTQKITNNPRGDFLADMRDDSSAAAVPNDRESWQSHLRSGRACDGAIMAFRSLWGTYERWLAEQGLQLPEIPAPAPVKTEQPATQMELIAL